jgi:hypothetical protein
MIAGSSPRAGIEPAIRPKAQHRSAVSRSAAIMQLLLDSSDDERQTKLAGVVENSIMQVIVVLEEAVKRLPKQ